MINKQYYFLQGGIKRSKRFDTEDLAREGVLKFLQQTRISRVTLRKARGGVSGSQIIDQFIIS